MGGTMSEGMNVWARFVAFIVGLLAVGTLLGYLFYARFAEVDASVSRSDSQTLARIEEQLIGVENRLTTLESHRKTEFAKVQPDVKTPEPAIPIQTSIQPAPRPRFRVSPESAMPAQPPAAPPPVTDPASAQRVARLQQGVGALEEQTTLNREAWQATTDRLAEVAGELGAQHGQIIKNHEELNHFL